MNVPQLPFVDLGLIMRVADTSVFIHPVSFTDEHVVVQYYFVEGLLARHLLQPNTIKSVLTATVPLDSLFINDMNKFIQILFNRDNVASATTDFNVDEMLANTFTHYMSVTVLETHRIHLFLRLNEWSAVANEQPLLSNVHEIVVPEKVRAYINSESYKQIQDDVAKQSAEVLNLIEIRLLGDIYRNAIGEETVKERLETIGELVKGEHTGGNTA